MRKMIKITVRRKTRKIRKVMDEAFERVLCKRKLSFPPSRISMTSLKLDKNYKIYKADWR